MFQNQRTTNSGSLKKSEWKNCWFQLFQKPESSCGFHEELEKNHLFYGELFDLRTSLIFLKNYAYES